MILFSRKTKYKKYQKSKDRFKGIDQRYILPKVGAFGLKLKKSSVRLTTQQIESSRKTIKRKIIKKSKEQVKMTVFPDLPVTKKSSGVRMGKGKGNINFWCCGVNQGRVIFELGENVPEYNAIASLKAGARKLPVSCGFLKNV